MRTFSKSKLLAYRQCPKRLWLEIHRKELRADSSATQASFKVGYEVGEIAQKLYDPKGKGQLINAQVEGFAKLKKSFLAINVRVVDLLRIAEQRYHHPSQQGSWSIKKVLPSVAPELQYGDLDGVQDGGMAKDVFLKAISEGVTASRKTQIEKQLLDYCSLDTYAMVRLWKCFSGRTDLEV